MFTTPLVSAQDCLLAAEGRPTPFRNVKNSTNLPREIQAIITSYNFGCCGNITAWQTYVDARGISLQNSRFDITFQVWRPSPTVQHNGCYSLVGVNKFTRIVPQINGLISVTPEPTNIITAQPQDVVGYSTFGRRNPQVSNGKGILLDTRYNDESVWYHARTAGHPLITGDPDCLFPVGTQIDRILISSINAAPVLSVSICKQ